MRQGEEKTIINLFANNKFTVGLFSFIYCLVIVFFIILAIVLPLKKFGNVSVEQFIFIALPAWILIAIPPIILAEGGKWGIYPHWFWTAFKKVEIHPLYGNIFFITGWWPFRFVKEYAGDLMNAIILTSKTYGDIGKKERFGLQLRFSDNTHWTFLTHFEDEQEIRKKARELSAECRCELIDKTYGPIVEIKKKKVKSQEQPAMPDFVWMDKQIIPGEIGQIPKGIKQEIDNDGMLTLVISRLHEWPANTCLSLFAIGIYLITVALGWANPKKPTAWEGIWGLFFGIIIVLLLKNILCVRVLQLDSSTLHYRFKMLGVTLKRNQMPIMDITKIATQMTDLLSRRLVIISDSLTIKMGDLIPEAGAYLKSLIEKIMHEEQVCVSQALS